MKWRVGKSWSFELKNAARSAKVNFPVERWQSGLTRTPGKCKTSFCPDLT
jgi:hypothetical protein